MTQDQNQTLAYLGLTREDVVRMTSRMRNDKTLSYSEPQKPYPRNPAPHTQAMIVAIENYLRNNTAEWRTSCLIAVGIGADPRHVANVLAAMVRSGMRLDKRIGMDRQAEYRWAGGAQ